MAALVLALSLFGVVMVFSASYYTSLSKFGNAYEYLKQDAIWMVVGWVALLRVTPRGVNKRASKTMPTPRAGQARSFRKW